MATSTGYTERLGLTKPGTLASRWDSAVNNNFDILDRYSPSIAAYVGERIEKGSVVASWNGTIYLASIADLADPSLRHAVGLCVSGDVEYGEYDAFLIHGVAYETSPYWIWTPDVPLYLSETPGELTEVPAFDVNGKFQYLGRAINETKILFDPRPPTAPTVLVSDGYPFKDGGGNPTNDFTGLEWDDTENRVLRSITFDGDNQDIDLWFEFRLPANFIAFPSGAQTVFAVAAMLSSAVNVSWSVEEVLDTDGNTIAISGVTGISTSLADILLPGSELAGGTFDPLGVVRVRVRCSGTSGLSGKVGTIGIGELRAPCLDV